MSGPTPRYVDCKCGHPRDWHPEDLHEECTDRFCSCREYVPKTLNLDNPAPAGRVAPIRPVSEPDPILDPTRAQSLDALLRAGKQSGFKRTVQLAEKIAVLLNDLRGRLADEREAAVEAAKAEAEREAARKELADLEAKLQEVRSRLAGKAAKPKVGNVVRVPRASGTEQCPDCGKGGLSNVGAHRTKAHGWRKAAAS